jgi:hypothetical protein
MEYDLGYSPIVLALIHLYGKVINLISNHSRTNLCVENDYQLVQNFDVNGENLLAINLLSKCQVRLGVGGDLMEVGVFHGRTAILFGLLAQSGETFYGIDAFGTSTEIQHEDRQVDLDYYGDF